MTIAFNLLLNAICSFMAGLLIIMLAQRIFRINTSRWQLFLLLLPFVKILWDLAHGVPADSYLYTGHDPLLLPPKSKSLQLGFGLTLFGPVLSLAFGVHPPGGAEYSISFADFIRALLADRFSPRAPAVLVGALLTVSACLIARRALRAWLFERERARRERSPRALRIGRERAGFRQVTVYVSPDHEGTPFTGGILRPYICFPESTLTRLADEESRAVLQHELAHVRHWDLPVSFAIQVLGDLFWFVPGYRWLSRKIDRLREVLADQAAVSSGASAAHLASALVKLRDSLTEAPPSVLYSAFVKEKSLLSLRVGRLLGEESAEPSPRLGWNNWLGRALITLWTSGGVMVATFAGNHEVAKVPEWLLNWLRSMGWA